ncbi:hypothetical protein I3842_08G124000 [Carya illinoinensis]|uniref:Uncharacterized protein n=1 Tax=Carya illinoinensis TaxID=32201 RepID=A0A922EDL8_CARIL|nr:hypothetical protein I3842_08G124000 [Carya illinoinensis]
MLGRDSWTQQGAALGIFYSGFFVWSSTRVVDAFSSRRKAAGRCWNSRTLKRSINLQKEHHSDSHMQNTCTQVQQPGHMDSQHSHNHHSDHAGRLTHSAGSTLKTAVHMQPAGQKHMHDSQHNHHSDNMDSKTHSHDNHTYSSAIK